MNDELQPRRALRQQARDRAITEARQRARQNQGSVLLPPPDEAAPEVVAVIESFRGAAPGPRDRTANGRAAETARREAMAILVNAAFVMSGSGIRVQGEPGGPVPMWVEPPAPEPMPSAKAKSRPKVTVKAKARTTARKASRPARRPVKPLRRLEVVPTPRERKPRPERHLPPDEVRCTATNSKGTRCRMESVQGSGGRCLLHSTARTTT